MAERNYDLTKGGVKYDNDKLEWSLIPMLECLEGVVRVLMYGAKKYTRDNWKAGMPWTRVSDAAKRHLFAWDALEDLDAETSLNHIDHALCELLFLRYYIREGVGEDDRFKRRAAGIAADKWRRDRDLELAKFLERLPKYNGIKITHDDDEAMEEPDDRDHWGV